jgi:hypothetical protein
MLKVSSVIVGFVAAVAIAQPSLAIGAASAAVNPVVATTPSRDLQAQVIFKIGTPEYRRETIRRERERERERIRRQEERRAARRDYYRNYRRY